jgi:hypothetical protein
LWRLVLIPKKPLDSGPNTPLLPPWQRFNLSYFSGR